MGDIFTRVIAQAVLLSLQAVILYVAIPAKQHATICSYTRVTANRLSASQQTLKLHQIVFNAK